jgi:hypothetical protein
MSAMTAGQPRRPARAASRRRALAPVSGQRVLTAVPDRRAPAAAPGPRGDRLRAPKPRTPVLTLVPPQQAAAPEQRPRTPALAPGPGAGERARQAVRRVPPQPARAGIQPRSRLTRRGRITVSALVMAAVLLVAALAWLAGATRADATRSGPPASAVYRSLASVVVQPGQSLWTIAAQAEPSADPRSVIQQIIDLNALGRTSIQPGQHLWVPRG